MTSKGRSKERYVQLTHGMIDSLAFRSLSTNAIVLYIHLERRYNSFNNGDISLSVREAAALLKVGNDTANRALKELLDFGFTRVAKHSAFNMKQRQARRWTLTRHPLRPGIPPTNDWRFFDLSKLEHGAIKRTEATIKGQIPLTRADPRTDPH